MKSNNRLKQKPHLPITPAPPRKNIPRNVWVSETMGCRIFGHSGEAARKLLRANVPHIEFENSSGVTCRYYRTEDIVAFKSRHERQFILNHP